MSDRIGLFAGSFDPVTNGHVDIIRRASGLFDKLYVGLFYNSLRNIRTDVCPKMNKLAYPTRTEITIV